jgi:hypothetical protein
MEQGKTKGREGMNETNKEPTARNVAWFIGAVLALVLTMAVCIRAINARELRQFNEAAAIARGVHEGGVHQWDLIRRYNQRTRQTWIGRRIVPAGWDSVEAIGGEVYRPAFTTATGRVIQ